MKRNLQSIALLATMLLVPPAVSAAEHSGEPGDMMTEDATIAVATVVAVDEKTRKVTLRGSEGVLL